MPLDVEDLQAQREALREIYSTGASVAIKNDKSIYHEAHKSLDKVSRIPFDIREKKTDKEMSTMHRADANQPIIVSALRNLGVSVAITSQQGGGYPDLTCALNKDCTFLIEVKDGSKHPSKQKLNKQQLKFHEDWAGAIYVVKSRDDVVDLINNLRKTHGCADARERTGTPTSG